MRMISYLTAAFLTWFIAMVANVLVLGAPRDFSLSSLELMVILYLLTQIPFFALFLLITTWPISKVRASSIWAGVVFILFVWAFDPVSQRGFNFVVVSAASLTLALVFYYVLIKRRVSNPK
jgi:hypothetical protein